MTRFRIRLAVAIGTSAGVAVLAGAMAGLVAAVVGGPAWVAGVTGCAVALIAGWYNVGRIRRRALMVFDDVLVVQRDRYRLVVPWQGVTAVQRRRHQGLFVIEELVCSGGRVEAVDSWGNACVLPEGLNGHPALTRVMVGLYSKQWRHGPIGDKLRALNIRA